MSLLIAGRSMISLKIIKPIPMQPARPQMLFCTEQILSGTDAYKSLRRKGTQDTEKQIDVSLKHIHDPFSSWNADPLRL
jgi:hypothetical protein